jgi:predicted alpha/beta-fold hydrolase
VINSSSFKPAWYLANAHFQTLWPFVFRNRHHPPVKHERLELPDGDFIDLVWTDSESDKPIVVILHGLEGSYRSHYIPGLLCQLQNAGFRCVVMHFRGCGGEPNRLDRAYHSGDTDDVAYLVQRLKILEPQAPVYAVGISLGGNVLLKWLGQSSGSNPLDAAVAVSVPFQLDICADTLNRGIARLYQYYLLRSLVNNFINKFSGRQAPFDVQRVAKIKTLREFDDVVTAPLHGFDNAAHYYAVSSSRQYLHTIKRPTLIIHAEDDPFMTPQVIPNDHELSSTTTLELSKKGGHVGFISNDSYCKINYVLDSRIKDFLLSSYTTYTLRAK